MNNVKCAPVVVFAYNRPQHLGETLAALSQNKEANMTDVIVYCDGPKCEEDLIKINQIRNILNKEYIFRSLRKIFREQNSGLSASVIKGVSEQFLIHESLIILEDDLLVSRYFLQYMNHYLKIYKNDHQVGSIHGYVYPIKLLPKTFFIRGADCWGWAAWKRSWDDFESDGTKLLNKLTSRSLGFKFNLFGGYNYMGMLRNQVAERNDSWAIRWHASMFLKHKLTLYPGESLVSNVGTDGSGSHFTSSDSSYDIKLENIHPKIQRVAIKESLYATIMFSLFFYKRKLMLLLNLIYHFLLRSQKSF